MIDSTTQIRDLAPTDLTAARTFYQLRAQRAMPRRRGIHRVATYGR